MRNINTVLLALLITTISFAQQGINYKALIKDGSGNVVANTPVLIQFRILQGTDLTIVYSDAQSPTTDANGIASVVIGEGYVISGVFETIDWSLGEYFLNVQVDIGNGIVDMGTTEIMSVPFAFHSETAITATTAANVTGLESIDEGNGAGLRTIGKDPDTAGDIGGNAVDLSQSPINSSTYGATGDYSVAMNRQTTAQGEYSTAMGLDSKAYGATSTVMGFNTVTNGFDAVAMGAYTVADASQSLAIGRYNVGGGNNQNWNPNDPIFEVGIGTGTNNKANAVTVLKNGSVGIGTHQPASSALLEMESTTQGILVPRLNSVQIAGILNPETSLLVYQTNGSPGFYYNAGTPSSPIWKKVGDEAATKGEFLLQYSPGTQNFTVPNGVHRVYFEMVAGGGGHGGTYLGTDDVNRGGGGGGGGGFSSGYLNVTPGEVLSLVVGARGNSGTSGTPGTSGTQGAESSIASGATILVRSIGGMPGSNGTSTSAGSGGAGGAISILDFNRVKLTCTNWAAMAGGSGITDDVVDSVDITGNSGCVNNIGDFNRLHPFLTFLFFTIGADTGQILTYRDLPYYGVGAGRSHAAQGGYIVLYW